MKMILKMVIGAALGPALAMVFAGAVALADPFSYDDLEALIRREQLSTVPAVLSRIPAPFMRGYVLMNFSRSLQGGSPNAPRAVVYGEDASFILSFNGDQEQRGYGKLEMIQWRPQSRSWEFRSIQFPEGGAPEFSGPNPPICSSCHNADSKPIWAGDPLWPGAYGDNFYNKPDEARAFVSFLERAKSDPRYRWLGRSSESALFPFAPPEAMEGPSVLAAQHRFRPNHRFTQLLARRNAEMIADRIVRSESWGARKWSLLTWLLGCDERISAELAAQAERIFRTRWNPDANRKLFADLDRITVPRFRQGYLIEKVFTGLELYTWNLAVRTSGSDLDQGAFGERMSTGEMTIDQWIAARLLERMAPSDSELAPHFRLRPYREVFDRLRAPGAADTQLAPGGVGDTYDRAGLMFDPSFMRACPVIARRAAAELGLSTRLK